MNRPTGANRFRPEPEPQAVGLVGNIAEFGNDVATLAELQAKLAVHDAKDCVGKATLPVIMLVVAGALALGSVPIILLGVASLIVRSSTLAPGAAQLLVGVAAVAIAGVTALIAWQSFGASLGSFRRSREELVRNISWIRTVLVHSGRMASRPRK